MQELLSLSGKSTAEEDIIQKLADASLLTTEGDLTHKDAFVEVAHEALIRELAAVAQVDRCGPGGLAHAHPAYGSYPRLEKLRSRSRLPLYWRSPGRCRGMGRLRIPAS